MPFFSIVIPLYNKEKFVESTLKSILSQTFPDYEIIIVDDGSTDGSVAVAEKFAGANIRIIAHDKNQGLSAARNTGIKNAASDFITFIDADDTWKPFFLEKMHELVGLFPEAGLFAAGYEETYPGNRALHIHKNLDFKAGEMNLVPDFFKANSHQPMFCFSSVVIKKAVFESAGLFDEGISLGEDVDFNIRANLKFRLAYYNISAAHYTIFSENQITNSSITNKTVTDFNKYENNSNPSLKKYLDVNRYILAMQYKALGNLEKFNALVSEINPENLSRRQRFLLSSPLFLVNLIKKIKGLFLKKGVRLTTFRK